MAQAPRAAHTQALTHWARASRFAESTILTYLARFPDSVVGLITNPKIAKAEYVEFFMRVAKSDLATFAPATAQKNINVAILNEVRVPLSPLAEQQEIIRRVEALFALADQIEARYAKTSCRQASAFAANRSCIVTGLRCGVAIHAATSAR